MHALPRSLIKTKFCGVCVRSLFTEQNQTTRLERLPRGPLAGVWNRKWFSASPFRPKGGEGPSEATGPVRGVVRPEGPRSQLSCWGSGCTGLQANPQPTSLHMKPPPSLPSPALAHPSEMNLILASCHKKSQSKPAITHCQIPGGCSNQTQHGVGMGLLGPCPLRLKFAALCSMYSPATLQIPVDAAL